MFRLPGKFILSLLGLLLLAGGTVLRAAEVIRRDNEFLVTKWTTEDGLPQNTVTSIVQTRNGYLWIGTFGGLVRFDGIKFTVFNSANTPALMSNRVLCLFEDKRGVLWIGSESGQTYRLVDGRFEEFAPEAGKLRKDVADMQEDEDGHFYVSSTSGLERFDFDGNGNVDAGSRKLLTNKKASYLVPDPEKRIWARIDSRYFVIEEGKLIPAESLGYELPSYPNRLQFRSDGSLYVAGFMSIGISDRGGYRELMASDPRLHGSIFDLVDGAGALWYQQADVLYEIGESSITEHSLSEYVKSGSRRIYVDRENNIWLATNRDGLVRMTRKRVRTLSDLSDSEVNNTYSVLEDPQGAVWVAGNDLFRIAGDKVSRFRALRDEGISAMKSLAVDPSGQLWVGGYPGLYVFRDERLVQVPGLERIDINCLFWGRSGDLWIGGNDGVRIYRDGVTSHLTTREGLANDGVHYITETSDGTVWIGTAAGISKYRNGTFGNITSRDGLSNGYVRDILEDKDGTIWVATYGGGINRIRGREIRSVSRRQGLHDDFVSRILVDDGGSFWMLGNLGIFSVQRDDLNAVANGEANDLIGSVYGVSDGMRSGEGSGAHQPAGYKTSDGRLWFPMIKDVAIIDPKAAPAVPPSVYVEAAFTRNQEQKNSFEAALFDSEKAVKFDNGLRNLEIQYTGLSFTKPEAMRFFYKLEGLDETWVDAGTRRTAFYPYLPSGKYRFRVKAVTASGIWSERTADLTIEVAKAFWETWWFIFINVLVFILAVIFLFRLRTNQLEKRQARQEAFAKRLMGAHEGERQRISKELHDGLGQHLLVIKNWAMLGLNESSDSERMRDQLEAISKTASEALDETRAIVSNLSPQNLKRFGLTEAITTMVEQIENSTGVVFELEVDNIDGAFPEEGEISIFRVIQEGLNNVIKHSESPRGRLVVSNRSEEVIIELQDHGKGFSTERFGEEGWESVGFGLQSISQRVKQMNGDLRIESVPGEGTTLRIRIRK
jgi:signal transduction histidine kinase/ligand-binding sensor domain-containing protein